MSKKREIIFGKPTSGDITGNPAKELCNTVAIWRLEEVEDSIGENIISVSLGLHGAIKFLTH